MANIVNNLRINGEEVKAIRIRLSSAEQWENLKEFYYNGILIWKNANPFIFLKDGLTEDKKKELLAKFGTDTIIFEGFNPTDSNQVSIEFTGSYSIVEDIEAELEKDSLILGQMVVETQEE